MISDCWSEFLFDLGLHIPKTIWRKELPLLKYYIEVVLRKPLVLMLGWEVGIREGFEKSAGKEGKFLRKYLDPRIWDEFELTFTDSNYSNIWELLFLFYTMLCRSSVFVAKRYGFCFPQGEEVRV